MQQIQIIAMIDTLSFQVPILHTGIKSDRILKVKMDGSIEWETITHRKVEGTWSSNAMVKSINQITDTDYTLLKIECSPKFVQGHNTFGTECIKTLINSILHKLATNLKNEIPEIAIFLDPENINHDRIEIFRIDINRMFQLPTFTDVQNWIRSAIYTSHTRSGRPSLKHGTIYWNKNSRRWAFKAYSKLQEIQETKQKLPINQTTNKLLHFLENLLRLELTLRKKELRDINLTYSSDFTQLTINELYSKYLEKINMTEKLHLTAKDFDQLPNRVKKTYQLWQAGLDPSLSMSRMTFYRHRQELQLFGIDISTPFARNETNIIPLVRVLEATPVSTPDWLLKSGLILAA
jgi:II/X family phage/plasmid replication protein